MTFMKDPNQTRPSRTRAWLGLAAGWLALIGLPSVASARVYISEFLATNNNGALDDGGDHSDWIELYNLGPAVSLSGWHLTDEVGNRTKWRFPNVTIAANGRLIVWASNKDKRDPAKALHTNFKLSGSGEYLGLIRSDGTTVEHDFAPTFPAQFPDISYGMAQVSSVVPLVSAGAALKYKVPIDGTDEAAWMSSTYDATPWTSAVNGIGYDRKSPKTYTLGIGADPPFIPAASNLENTLTTGGAPWLYNVSSQLYTRFEFDVADPGNIQSLKLKMRVDDAFVAYLNGVLKAETNISSAATVGGVPLRPVPFFVPGTTTVINAPSQIDGITEMEFPLGATNGALLLGRNVLAVHGFNLLKGNSDFLLLPTLEATLAPTISGALAYFTTPTFNANNPAGTSLVGPLVADVPVTLPPPVTNSQVPEPVADSQLQFSGVQGQNGWFYGYQIGTGAYNVNTSMVQYVGGSTSGAWNATTNHWNGTGWDRNTAGAQPWTYNDSTTLHPNGSNSAAGDVNRNVVRWVSTFAGQATISLLWNCPGGGDGTTGWLYRNGTQLFTSTSVRNDQSTTQVVTLAIGDKIDFVLSAGPAENDGSDSTTYRMQIAPGAAAAASISLPITARVQMTQNPLASVVLKWRLMFAAEQSLPMNDAGTGSDLVAGDGLYSATITTNQLLNGQMIRWRVLATDSTGLIGRDPPVPTSITEPNFESASLTLYDGQKYYGTIGNDPSLNSSLLPVVHWFSNGATEGAVAAPLSLYYLGEFYDNCGASGHGQSSAGAAFPRKSNDIDSPSDHRLKYTTDPNAKRVKDINFLQNYSDKTKMRSSLTYQIYDETGSPCHFAFPIRMQRNGLFYALYNVVEDADDRWMERIGFDPEGALFKVYNTLSSAAIGVNANVEKKTRKTLDIAGGIATDFQGLLDGLVESKSLSLRRQFAYDNVSLPTFVNYMAVSLITNNQDQGHKNYYMYRDTNRSREWHLLPWDVDLSFGHTWTSAQGYWDDDIDSQRGPTLGAGNRLKSLIDGASSASAPEISAMFLRRLRTLLDKYYTSSDTPASLLEQKMLAYADLIDPIALGQNSDAWLDFKKWGFWVDGGNGAKNEYSALNAPLHTLRAQLARVINSNPAASYPTGNPSASMLNNTTFPFLVGHRALLYAPTFVSQGAPLPAAQVAAPAITIETTDFQPGRADQEYFSLLNSGTTAVDVSDWTIEGAVDFKFKGGTVIPAGGGATENIGRLFVAKDTWGFRSRTAGPRAGLFCYCVGPYDGQMSARGETLTLKNAAGTIIATKTYSPAPTPAQVSLRVTEILYAPKPPTVAERAALPYLIASDFEWMELTNLGLTPIVLAGANFNEGIGYIFPVGTPALGAGQSIIVAADPAAFALRYPGITPVYGGWTGDLDNDGEKIHLDDSVGESVLEFSYNDSWSPATNHNGHSLVIIDPTNTPYNEWGGRPRWIASATAGGTPGTLVQATGLEFETWQPSRFNTAERDDPIISGPNANPDADQLSNLVEYALGSNPKASSQAHLPTAATITAGGETYLTLSYRRQKAALDLTYIVESSENLSAWDPATEMQSYPTDNGDGTETVVIRDSMPSTNEHRRYIHLRVVK
jgi:CotH kinase protein/Lamin Tail Domain